MGARREEEGRVGSKKGRRKGGLGARREGWKGGSGVVIGIAIGIILKERSHCRVPSSEEASESFLQSRFFLSWTLSLHATTRNK